MLPAPVSLCCLTFFLLTLSLVQPPRNMVFPSFWFFSVVEGTARPLDSVVFHISFLGSTNSRIINWCFKISAHKLHRERRHTPAYSKRSEYFKINALCTYPGSDNYATFQKVFHINIFTWILRNYLKRIWRIYMCVHIYAERERKRERRYLTVLISSF